MKQFVTYEQAKKLCDVMDNVYDLDCQMAYYTYPWMKKPRFVHLDAAYDEQRKYDGTDVYVAPTLAQLAAWMRKNGWHIQVMINDMRSSYFVQIFETKANGDVIKDDSQYDEYEDALSHGIDIVIDVLLSKYSIR